MTNVTLMITVTPSYHSNIPAQGNARVKTEQRTETIQCRNSKSKGSKSTQCRDQTQLVIWYFDLSQPQRILSGLKTNFSLSPIILHTSHQTTKSLRSTKSVQTQISMAQRIETQTSNTKFSKNQSVMYCPC